MGHTGFNLYSPTRSLSTPSKPACVIPGNASSTARTDCVTGSKCTTTSRISPRSSAWCAELVGMVRPARCSGTSSEFEKANFEKPVFHFIDSRVETGRSQAMGKVD
jgi:hypothetical protein